MKRVIASLVISIIVLSIAYLFMRLLTLERSLKRIERKKATPSGLAEKVMHASTRGTHAVVEESFECAFAPDGPTVYGPSDLCDNELEVRCPLEEVAASDGDAHTDNELDDELAAVVETDRLEPDDLERIQLENIETDINGGLDGAHDTHHEVGYIVGSEIDAEYDANPTTHRGAAGFHSSDEDDESPPTFDPVADTEPATSALDVEEPPPPPASPKPSSKTNKKSDGQPTPQGKKKVHATRTGRRRATQESELN